MEAKVFFTANLKHEPSWIFNYIENYSHLNLKIKFKTLDLSVKLIKFAIEIGLQGFEGQILYIYMSSPKRIQFDLINHLDDNVHHLDNLNYNSHPLYKLDFVIVPFGHFRNENKLSIGASSSDLEIKYNLYAWTPSFLFKKVKSVIKIHNEYVKITPLSINRNKSYHVQNWFKANDSGLLLDLINHLSNYDEYCEVSDIKSLISKANEYLFEVSENQTKNIIKELERLKNNVENLSKEDIINWINDMINFYSDKS